LTVTPSSISKTLAWGGTGTSTLTVKNTGTAPATLDLAEGAGGFAIQSGPAAPVQKISGEFPKTDMATAAKQAKARAAAAGKSTIGPKASPTAGAAWQPIANSPTTIQDNI